MISCTDSPVSADVNASADSLLNAINQRIIANPEDVFPYLERARYWMERDQQTLALEDLNRAVAADSSRTEPYFMRGEFYFVQKKYNDSYQDFTRCLSCDSLHVMCLLKKAGLDIVLGNFSIAREHINSALRKNPYEPYAYYLRGRLYKTLGDTDEALSAYMTSLEVNPSYYESYIETGLLYAARGNDLARDYYSSAISLKPQSVEAWYNKAMFLQETGSRDKSRYTEAFACYDSILKRDPKFVGAYFNKGFIHLEYLQAFDSAAYYFSRAIELYPEYYQAFYNRGLANESLNLSKQAEQDYRQALALKPDYDEAAISLGRVLGE
jgi:tetratricopeptide (TPR) repeat protein